MAADPDGFRTKFRKMAADPFAFYRGSACLFYADMEQKKDKFGTGEASRVWIHGDLHAENFGTYMNSEGMLVFDVNDFDEAYLGHFSWDLRRFVASLALMGWQKALPEDSIRELANGYLQAYVDMVGHYVEEPEDQLYALRLDNTEGAIHDVLLDARMSTRLGLLDKMTVVADHERQFRRSSRTRDLNKSERRKVEAAFNRYLKTIPEAKREHQEVFYDVKDIVGTKGFGIGSAGLPAYNVLIEGYNQALENDIVLSMKQGNVPAASRVAENQRAREFFEHEGHRTVVSQRALQVHTDPFLGHTTVDGVGFVVDELSPYEADLDWGDITEPDEIAPVLVSLGHATAKIHCISDADSEEELVDFSTEHVIAEAIGDDVQPFIDELVEFAVTYAGKARRDHALFIDAFRSGRFDLVSAT
ncbi:MAG: DUF2252 domain-containing protein [Nocardioidaceae bacterium]|nr:DUF2252 domain-containing protein [Nocardioidaceae bacterium]